MKKKWPMVRALDGQEWPDNRIAIDDLCRLRLRDLPPPYIHVAFTFTHWCWMLLGWPSEEAWGHGRS